MAELYAESPWGTTGLLALLAVAGSALLHSIGGRVLRRASQGTVVLRAMLRSVERSAGFTLPLLALQAIWQAAPNTLGHIESVRHANALMLIAALTWLATAVVDGVAAGIIARFPADVEDNLQARRVQTQARVLARSAMGVILIAGASMMLMTFPGARQVGASLLASAGVLGLIAGIAARPVFSNLIAGLQLALAQPLRLDDVLIVKGEYGRVEEITGTYVVLKLWDERRMVVPLQWFIENPFENWTRSSAQLHQAVYLFVDFAMPVDALRAELRRVVEADPEWDGRTANLMVTDTTEWSMKLRVLVSANASGRAFELGCRVREALLAYLARDYPALLPRQRHGAPGAEPPKSP